MGALSLVHWVIVLVIVMLVFGTKRVGSMGADIGKAIKDFKNSIRGDANESGNIAKSRIISDKVHTHEPSEK
jgi:sec-independent protein translocase protein TatA